MRDIVTSCACDAAIYIINWCMFVGVCVLVCAGGDVNRCVSTSNAVVNVDDDALHQRGVENRSRVICQREMRDTSGRQSAELNLPPPIRLWPSLFAYIVSIAFFA